MRNVRIPPKSQWSIFGDTYNGVPNPNTVLVHGYPTRYHGPNFTVPQQSYAYRLKPYARAPFLGIDGLGQAPGILSRIASAIRGRRVKRPSRSPAFAAQRIPLAPPTAPDPDAPGPAPPCMNPWPLAWALWDVDEVWNDYSAITDLCADDLPRDDAGKVMRFKYFRAVKNIRAAIAWGAGRMNFRWCRDTYSLDTEYIPDIELLHLKEMAVRAGMSDCSPWPTREKLAMLQQKARERVLPLMAALRRPMPVSGLGEPGGDIPHRWFSALVGGTAGVLAAPNKNSQLAYVGIGALSGALLGNVGSAAMVAAAAGSKVMNAPLPKLELSRGAGAKL